jgi:hypothetical protein
MLEEKEQCFASGFELNLGGKMVYGLIKYYKLLLVVSA